MVKKTFWHTIRALFLVGAITSACSLPKGSTPLPSSVPVDTTPASGISVQITSPAAGAQLSAGESVQVTFKAMGGPFLEFDLIDDNAIVASQPSSTSDAQVTGSLQWDKPADGSHTLKLQVVDLNKNIASAEVQVQVGAGAPANSLSPTATVATSSTASGELRLRFVNATDGGTINASLDDQGKPVVTIKLEISGPSSPMFILNMTANGVIVPGDVRYTAGTLPYTAEIRWSPLGGGGKYTLVATATNDTKQTVQTTVQVTVAGMAAFTATPPPLDQIAARKRFTQLYQQLYGMNIPAPSMQRFDFPDLPNRSRWISDIYYKGQRYYIELFDDTHYELSPASYSDAAHRRNEPGFIICRPAGHYKILVVYVDYGNLTVDKNDALAQVPVFANWTNQLYNDFARSQGLASSPLSIEAQAAWISPPPSRGNLLTAEQITSATGLDPSKYNFVVQIDLDRDNTVGTSQWKGILEQGGGIALQGCGGYYDGNVNIFSVVQATDLTQAEIRGVLSMDFNHELGHLFGMLDSWPFKPGAISSPDGIRHDDWIPYVMFGWTDADGDGIPEIIDPTPYGTSGPQP